jgi:hypothetical protein
LLARVHHIRKLWRGGQHRPAEPDGEALHAVRDDVDLIRKVRGGFGGRVGGAAASSNGAARAAGRARGAAGCRVKTDGGGSMGQSVEWEGVQSRTKEGREETQGGGRSRVARGAKRGPDCKGPRFDSTAARRSLSDGSSR